MKKTEENPMRKIKLEKVTLSVGGVGEELEKGVRLLEMLTKRKPAKMKTKKRIPALGIRPKLEVGAVVTIRKNPEEILKRLLAARNNMLNMGCVGENSFSFGIKEYIEIPGAEYQRDLGIRGLDVTVTFSRAGRRIKLKKIKRGKIAKKQNISKEEIIQLMEENFNTKFI
ncbi:50S ribosomal protein L5 [Candidatus Pacearchaeota archaeon]|nr:50S ribosomal protein L5 [Candidatus Pacearchaeota archaeon]